MKRFFCLTVVLVVLLSISVSINSNICRADEKIYNLKLVCDFPPSDYTSMKALPKFINWVDKESNGRIKVKLFTAGQLIPPAESFDNLRAGAFDLLYSCPAYHAGKFPAATAVFVLPMGPRDVEDHHKLWYEYGVHTMFSKAYKEKFNIKFLGFSSHVGKNLLLTKPVKTLKDFKGLKLRTAGPHGKLWAAVGAAPVFIPGGEIYMALQTGVVDGVEWNNPAVETMKLGEVAKYMVCGYPNPPGICTAIPCIGFYANQNSFNKLPQDLREVFIACSERFLRYNEQMYLQWEDWFYNKGGKEKYRMTICNLSEEDTNQLRKIAIKDIWPEMARDSALSAEYIEKVKQLLRDEGVIK